MSKLVRWRLENSRGSFAGLLNVERLNIGESCSVDHIIRSGKPLAHKETPFSDGRDILATADVVTSEKHI